MVAKLLVLSRLLHKSLSAQEDIPPTLNGLGTRLVSLRQKLLRHVDRRLVLPNSENSVLIEDLTAFSLATSSGPSEVLIHFQHLRANAISELRRESDCQPRKSILERLRLYLDSIRESRAIFPDLLGGSLRVLGARALLQDPTIAGSDDLNLGVHERWLGDDVRNYTPWTRHEQLSKAKTQFSVKQWSTDKLNLLAKSVEDDIAHEQDVSQIAAIRKEALQAWLSARSIAQGLDARQSLLQLRKPFIGRIEGVIARTSKLFENAIYSSMISIVEQGHLLSGKVSPSLWDQSNPLPDLSDGAVPLRNAVVQRRTGHNGLVTSVLVAHDQHLSEVEKLQAAIKEMRDIRWDDDFDEDEDEDDVEGTDSILKTLSRRDPQQLHDALRTKMLNAIASIQAHLSAYLTSNPEHLKCDSAASPGIPIYRSLRALRQRLPHLLRSLTASDQSPSPGEDLFCPSLVNTLQDNLAASVREATFPVLNTSLSKFSAAKTLPIRALWDNGRPALPIQPSPMAFRYLQAVMRKMQELGMDLWSPDCVGELKVELNAQVEKEMRGCVEDCISKRDGATAKEPPSEVADGDEEKEAEKSPPKDDTSGAQEDSDTLVPPDGNGDGDEDGKPTTREASRDSQTTQLHITKSIQLFFDTLYLREALSPPSQPAARPDDDDKEAGLIETLMRESGLEGEGEEAAMKRLRKGAGEYWRRTYAVFGLLAAESASSSVGL